MSIDLSDVKYATGKRKTAVAKCWLSPKGNGDIKINNIPASEYFSRAVHLRKINEPFNFLDLLGKYDVKCFVFGGGLSGKAGAISHAISKALGMLDEEFRKSLRNSGMLTRDSRIVERKKPGLRKARKKRQFSKR